MASNYYGGVVWTNHALSRLNERGFTKDMVVDAFHHPDISSPAKDGGTSLRKTFGASTVTVIAKQNQKNEWVIISCWIDPPLEGTPDYRKKQNYLAYQKASFWGKLFLILKKQLGL